MVALVAAASVGLHEARYLLTGGGLEQHLGHRHAYFAALIRALGALGALAFAAVEAATPGGTVRASARRPSAGERPSSEPATGRADELLAPRSCPDGQHDARHHAEQGNEPEVGPQGSAHVRPQGRDRAWAARSSVVELLLLLIALHMASSLRSLGLAPIRSRVPLSHAP